MPLTTGIEIQTEELYLPGPASVIILTNATDWLVFMEFVLPVFSKTNSS